MTTEAAIFGIWILSASVGLAISVLGASDALRDLRALPSVANGRRLVGRQRLTAQILRAVIFTGWLIAATHSDLAPIVLVAGNVALAIVGASDFAVGVVLRRRYAREADLADKAEATH